MATTDPIDKSRNGGRQQATNLQVHDEAKLKVHGIEASATFVLLVTYIDWSPTGY
jgi:hypothetical protein